MKRRRWLAMAMAVVMTASSIPAGTFTAFAAEEEVWVDSLLHLLQKRKYGWILLILISRKELL